MTDADGPAYEGWAIVELMGHRQSAGFVRQVAFAGSELLRIDTPGPDGEMAATQFYGGGAIYCVTPCDEMTAREALRDAYSLPPPVRVALAQAERPTNPALPFDPRIDDAEDAEIDELGHEGE